MRFTIPGNSITKKNSQRLVMVNGHPRILPSKQFAAYQKACEKYIPCKWYAIDNAVNIKCVYYMRTRRKVDLCNLLAATCDILVHYAVIQDDNSGIVVSHDGSCVCYDKEHPRVEIEITEVGDG